MTAYGFRRTLLCMRENTLFETTRTFCCPALGRVPLRRLALGFRCFGLLKLKSASAVPFPDLVTFLVLLKKRVALAEPLGRFCS